VIDRRDEEGNVLIQSLSILNLFLMKLRAFRCDLKTMMRKEFDHDEESEHSICCCRISNQLRIR
jgi:hypothetical protein